MGVGVGVGVGVCVVVCVRAGKEAKIIAQVSPNVIRNQICHMLTHCQMRQEHTGRTCPWAPCIPPAPSSDPEIRPTESAGIDTIRPLETGLEGPGVSSPGHLTQEAKAKKEGLP